MLSSEQIYGHIDFIYLYSFIHIHVLCEEAILLFSYFPVFCQCIMVLFYHFEIILKSRYPYWERISVLEDFSTHLHFLSLVDLQYTYTLTKSVSVHN